MYDITAAGREFDLPEPADRFLDRELSWLAFNERVLDLASDPEVPLLERVRFLSIFATNLDEFFMVRVAGLKRRINTGLAVPTVTGRMPRQVMHAIGVRAHELMTRHAELLKTEIGPALDAEAIIKVSMDDLRPEERARVDDFFARHVFPVLTPLAVDPAHPFPYISGLSLNLGVLLRYPETGKELFARVKVPPRLPRFFNIATHSDRPVDRDVPARFVALEDIIAEHLDTLFEGMEIVHHSTFRVTRNEDLEVEEDDAENLLKALEKELLRRRFGPAVRLEITENIHPRVREMLKDELGIDESEIYELPMPLDLSGMSDIADVPRDDLHFPRMVPQMNKDLSRRESSDQVDVFAAVSQRDILLHHPYDSFSTSVQAFLEQAAADKNVLAIKQTLYRTSGDSPIIDALVDAAQAGIQVLAVVEIKARFDEEANITWARKLERAGVHVVYGIVGLKTHAKLSLVVRQEAEGLARYCHVGSGNYHPKTARHYEDFGLLTKDTAVADDLTKLFNQLSGYAPRAEYSRLLVAPTRVRAGLIELIDREIAIAEAGRTACVRIKVNSIVDEAIIDALYRASRAGVSVEVFVRGICALRPGIPGLSENITVRSVLGRFLEHSRAFVFGNDGDPTVYIGSADMMHRNLDRRVEALIELRAADHKAEIIELFDLAFDPGTSAFELSGDGTWTRRTGAGLIDYQSELIRRHRRRRMMGEDG
ncbi:polyphosphate kinase [Brevibacterium sanguinis]|uniref:Polyphosphate kinase n=2 Tax=Brevibacterium TaxID=1696 RepID=A0A366IMJ8_9MICO|nr:MULTISPECIES: RNA degradosome polyphosphate kinase [Brevibacterium]RBP65642.1 polyphosphate kinase [Brevibacterium sanguinis]RBP72276.1 polyphosphate kinase [Brevibacterium celere]